MTHDPRTPHDPREPHRPHDAAQGSAGGPPAHPPRPDDPHHTSDPNDPMGTTMHDVAGELTAELLRSDEREVPLPPALAKRLTALGEAEVGRRLLHASAGTSPAGAPRGATWPPAARGWTGALGWLAAAAALVLWLVAPRSLSRAAGEAGLDLATGLPRASAPQALLDSLLQAPTTMRVSWAASTDPAATAATGEVVWDPATQRGVMRFAGLVPNDPRLAQYQLWIIDAERDARYPVDGGVFDVTAAGEVLVPITARLRVARPTLFAITLEKPGGVVVSARERLVLAAPVAG